MTSIPGTQLKPLTDPDEVTGQLRLREMYQRQRQERGFGNTSTQDLLAEADITIRLLEALQRAAINLAGEHVRRSIERG